MNFLWPEALWLLLAVPALAALYVYLLLRRKRAALRFASIALAREAAGGRGQWRRHVPAALFLLAIAAAIVATARPTAVVTLPAQHRTLVLAIDVSLSMRASDVLPYRLAAAQAAAKNFVREQPPDVRIGIVSFAGTALLVQKPTTSKDELIAAIDRLQLDRQTALGSGIIMSLATLFPKDGIDLETMVLGSRSSWGLQDPGRRTSEPPAHPVPPGSNHSVAIVLLTDGRPTTGPDPLEAARMAAERGVRVYTIGFGQAGGGRASMDGYAIFMMFDEEMLKAIAALTHAEYFHAASIEQLDRIYRSLTSKFELEKEPREVSALFAAAAAALAIVAGILSLAWFNRLV